MHRRAFVTTMGGGLAGILACRRAPAWAQGMTPEDAVRWAEGELKRIYEA